MNFGRYQINLSKTPMIYPIHWNNHRLHGVLLQGLHDGLGAYRADENVSVRTTVLTPGQLKDPVTRKSLLIMQRARRVFFDRNTTMDSSLAEELHDFPDEELLKLPGAERKIVNDLLLTYGIRTVEQIMSRIMGSPDNTEELEFILDKDFENPVEHKNNIESFTKELRKKWNDEHWEKTDNFILFTKLFLVRRAVVAIKFEGFCDIDQIIKELSWLQSNNVRVGGKLIAWTRNMLRELKKNTIPQEVKLARSYFYCEDNSISANRLALLVEELPVWIEHEKNPEKAGLCKQICNFFEPGGGDFPNQLRYFREEARRSYITWSRLDEVCSGKTPMDSIVLSTTLTDFRWVLESMINRSVVRNFQKKLIAEGYKAEGKDPWESCFFEEIMTPGRFATRFKSKGGKSKNKHELKYRFARFLKQSSLQTEKMTRKLEVLSTTGLFGIAHRSDLQIMDTWESLFTVIKEEMYGNLALDKNNTSVLGQLLNECEND